MNNSIMNCIGGLVFMALCSHYKNDPDEYLAILRYDRESVNNVGLNPMEYGLINLNNEDKFLQNLDLTVKPWAKYLEVSSIDQ